MSSETSREASGENGAVSSVSPFASQAGLSVLKAGGNAVDAAVATALTLSVTAPSFSGIGGGGFMLVYLAEKGESHVVDYRETAPKRAAADMFEVGSDGEVIGLTGLMGKGDEAEVEPAIVSEPHRRRGIGRRLMETVITEARNRGVKYLSVRPVARNEEAIRFFVSQGFGNVGHIELFMDLTDGEWKEGLNLFGLELKY